MRTLITEKLELQTKARAKRQITCSCPDQPQNRTKLLHPFYLSTERTSLNRANTQPIMKAAGSFKN